MKWISNLLARLRDEPTVVKVIDVKDVRVEVLEFLLPCGHHGYGFYVLCYAEELKEWVPVANLRDFNIEEVIQGLNGAKEYVSGRLVEEMAVAG